MTAPTKTPMNWTPRLAREDLVHDVAGVACVRGFKHQNFGLGVGHRAMLDATRHDAELTGLQSHAAVAELDSHPTAPDQEELILTFVMVPGKDTGELHQFHFLAVQLRNDLRSPMLVNQ